MAPIAELLSYLRRGPARGAELRQHVGISQPTFSRLVRALPEELLVVGRARATRYAARRAIANAGTSLPVHAIGDRGRVSRVATLHAVEPGGFWVEPEHPTIGARFHQGLPYFLFDMRPAGFLGRLIPRRHPELGAPIDITRWSDDDCVRFFFLFGWNLPGNLVVGDSALELYLEHVRAAGPGLTARQRARAYPRIVDDILAHGPVGSSAAGEQPKFLATRAPHAREVLVKFSPPLDTPAGRRWADLLAAEQIGTRVLRDHGFPSPRSDLVDAGNRRFLEVERFDRTPGSGRRGVLSLMALDLEWVGSNLASWAVTATELGRQGRLDEATVSRVRQLELFGALIGNTDMHAGNLSFMATGEQVLDLAPAYDMVPMLFAPQHDEVVDRAFTPPTPRPIDGPVWRGAARAAVDFWEAVARHDRVSADFAELASHCADAVRSVEKVAALLPP